MARVHPPLMAPTRDFVTVSGRWTARLLTQPETGGGDGAGLGPAVMLLHGVPTSSDLWIPVMEQLGERRVLAPDLPGYGRSEAPDNPHLGEYHRFITELANGQGLGRFVLVGHDLGGLYALTYALRNPQALRGLVLLNTTIYPDPRVVAGLMPLLAPGFGEAYAWLAGRIRYSRMLTRGLRAMYPSSTQPWLLDALTRPYVRTSAWLSLLRSLRGLSPWHVLRLRRKMSHLDLPVLILWGEHDPYFAASVPARLHADLPMSTLQRVPNAGHFLMLSRPREVAQALDSFLRALEAPGEGPDR